MKEATSDPVALNNVKLTTTSVRYKLVDGLADDFTDTVSQNMCTTPHSVNVDEAQNKNSPLKIFTILVSYFSMEQKKTLVYHLRSIQVLNTKAETFFDAFTELYKSLNKPLSKLFSVMLDNCPGMRGEVSGVETRLKEVQPNLQPLGGDAVHTCHTAAKKTP